MATEYDNTKKEKDFENEEQPLMHRLVITSTNMKTAEKLVSNVAAKVEEMKKTHNVKANGAARLPRKTLSICTRKSPCGNGTETFDRYEMRIFKRVITLWASQTAVDAIIKGLGTEPDVIVELTCFDDDDQEEY